MLVELRAAVLFAFRARLVATTPIAPVLARLHAVLLYALRARLAVAILASTYRLTITTVVRQKRIWPF